MIKSSDIFDISISESNIFQKSENLEVDFEITTLDFSYYYPISRSLEFTFNYPFYYISRGFLDNFLNSVHSSLKIETTRENEGHKDNQLQYRVTDAIYKDSAYYVSGNPQLELKYNFYRYNSLYIATNIGIKIPLGSVEDGFTTKKIDLMVGIELQKNYNQFSIISNAIVIFNGDYRLSSDIISKKYRYFLSLGSQVSVDYFLDLDFINDTSFLFTYQYSSAPYESRDEKFSSYTHLLQFALREQLDDGEHIDIFFNQNTIPRHNEADVTFGLSYYFKGL